MRDTGILSRRQRQIAWLALVLLAAQSPVAALLLPDDSWLFSLTVAAMVAVVIVADDLQRRSPSDDV